MILVSLSSTFSKVETPTKKAVLSSKIESKIENYLDAHQTHLVTGNSYILAPRWFSMGILFLMDFGHRSRFDGFWTARFCSQLHPQCGIHYRDSFFPSPWCSSIQIFPSSLVFPLPSFCREPYKWWLEM